MTSERTAAVIQVGTGRGFIVEDRRRRYVITAAHCLPYMPPAHAAALPVERTYKRLLGLLGRRPTVWATCVFVDPVADIAVLAEPDNQALADEYERYVELTDPVVPFLIGGLIFTQRQHRASSGDVFELPPEANAEGQMLSLDQQWFACRVKSRGWNGCWVQNPERPITSGMSGSPILGPGEKAVAVVSTSDLVG